MPRNRDQTLQHHSSPSLPCLQSQVGFLPHSQPLSLGSPGWGGNGGWAGPGPSCSERTVWAKQHTSQTGLRVRITTSR